MDRTATEATQVIELITGMAEIRGREISDAGISMFLAAMDGHSVAAIRAAFNAHARRSKWFPQPSEIIEIMEAGSKPEPKAIAMEAWARVLEHVRDGQWRYRGTGDRAIDETIRVMGGWSRMGEMKTSEFPFREKEFAEKFVLTADSASRIEGPVADSVAGLLEGIGGQNE